MYVVFLPARCQMVLETHFGASRRLLLALKWMLTWKDDHGTPVFDPALMVGPESLTDLYDRYPLLPIYLTRVPVVNKGVTATAFQPTYALEDINRRLVQQNGIGALNQGGRVGPNSNEMWHGSLYRSSYLFAKHKLTTPSGHDVYLGDRLVFDHLDDEGTPMCSLGVVASIVNVEPDNAIGCLMRRYRAGPDGTVVLDWTGTGEYLVKPPALRPENTPEYVCNRALIELRNGDVQNVPLAYAPSFPIDDFPRDLRALDQRISDSGLEVLKLFEVSGWDAFNACSKVYHSTKGRYVTLGNLPYCKQSLMANLPNMTMSPPGVGADASAAPFIAGVQKLEEGYVEDFGPLIGKRFVMGGLGLAPVDNPQAADDAGAQHHNAKLGCKTCLCPRTHNSDLETCFPLRTEATMSAVRAEADALVPTARKAHLNSAGLSDRTTPVYKDISFNVWDGVPADVFHQWVLGTLKRVTSEVAASLTDAGLQELNWLLLNAKPLVWSHLPTIDLTSGKGTDRRHVKGSAEYLRKQVQLLPVVFPGWLDETKLRRVYLVDLARKHGSIEMGISKIIASVTQMGLVYAAVFALNFTNEPGRNSGASKRALDAIVTQFKRAVLDCWEGIRGFSLAQTTNIHTIDHTGHTLRLIGAPRLTSTARMEAAHVGNKQATKNSNKHNIEVDMQIKHDRKMAINFLVMGGAKHLYNAAQLYPEEFLRMLTTDPLPRRLIEMAGKTTSYVAKSQNAEDDGVLGQQGVIALTKDELYGIDGAPAKSRIFSKVRLPDRAGYASRLQRDWYYYVRFEGDLQHHVAELRYVSVGPTGSVQAHMIPMASVGHEHLNCKILAKTPDIEAVRSDLVGDVVHVIPHCVGASGDCLISSKMPCPVGFTPSCIALNGVHVETGQYLLNRYFVK